MLHLYKIYRYLFARRKFQKMNQALFEMSLRGMGILNYENSKVSGEKYLIKRILPEVIKNNAPVFFDIGANVGNYSAELIRDFPGATVYAFEPHPKNYKSLNANISSGRLKSHNIAIGSSCGEAIFYDRADYDGSSHASLHEAVISEIHKQEVVKTIVPVITLDDFVKEKGITYIDFMKVDTEGNELNVLIGASMLLESGNVGCIHFEFNEMNIVSRAFFRDFRKVLYGYDLFRLLPDGLLHLNDSPLLTELFAYQNIFALPKNVRKKYRKKF